MRWGRVRIAVMKRRILVIRRVFSIPSDSEVGQKVRQPAPRVSVAADGNMLRRDEGVQNAFLHGLHGGLEKGIDVLLVQDSWGLPARRRRQSARAGGRLADRGRLR